MARTKKLLPILLIFIMAIYSNCDTVETQEEIQAEIQREETYVPPTKTDALGNILITELSDHIYFLY